jgi:hypothetical protein
MSRRGVKWEETLVRNAQHAGLRRPLQRYRTRARPPAQDLQVRRSSKYYVGQPKRARTADDPDGGHRPATPF